MEKDKTKHTFKICRSCSFFAGKNEETKFCPDCGSELISACPNCKGIIDNPYANFCKLCGAEYPGRQKKIFKKF